MIRALIAFPLCLGAIAITALADRQEQDEAPRSQPNVIFILLDDLRFDGMGFLNDKLDTPSIDALARGGAYFPNTVVTTLDELIPMQDTAAGGTVAVSCSRAVATLGLPLSDGVFTALAAVDLEVRDESQSNHILPLVLDGEGFQSHLVVTNLSESDNQCTMHLYGAGMNTAKFENAVGVTKDGFPRAMIELAGLGDQVSMSSIGGRFLACGYAALDCDAPVAVRNLLSVHSGESVAMIAASTARRSAGGIAA